MTKETTDRARVTVAPYADIYEKEDGLLLVADMPGVDENSANVKVEDGLLVIEGDIKKRVGGDFCPIRAERRADAFRRTFEISDAIDTTKITANMKDGVLTLNLPRREERKARKIDITAA